jgi:hypothetical protein
VPTAPAVVVIAVVIAIMVAVVIIVAVAITPAPAIPVADAIIIPVADAIIIPVADTVIVAPAVADAEPIIVVAASVEEATAHAARDARRRVAVIDEDRPSSPPAPVSVIVRARGDERGQREDEQEHRHLQELSQHRGVLLSSTGVNASPAPVYLVEGRD